MPPRWLCVLIVAAWLATTGRLVVTDLLPRLLPGTPPSVTVELTEEAEMEKPFVYWNLSRDGQQVMRSKTRVRHVARGQFELTAAYEPLEKGAVVPFPPAVVRAMSSAYRVSADGNLLGVTVHINGRADIARLFSADFVADVEGAVVGGALAPRLQLVAAGFDRELNLPATAVPRGGALLLPLHPVNRLRDLRPGQAWTLWLFDPIGDTLDAFQGAGGEMRLLRARVRAEAEDLVEGTRREPCLVIDYAGDGFEGRTWVSTRSGLVLMQEATLKKARWAMVRD